MIFSIIEQQLVAGLAGSIDMKQRGEIADIPQSSNFAGRVAENRTTKLSRFSSSARTIGGSDVVTTTS